MFLRRCTFLLLLCLIASDANAVRKTKRPVKPAKQTIPRTNVTPPPAALAATTSSSSSSTSSSTTTTTTSEQSAEAAPLASSTNSAISNSELPKPLLPQTEAQPEPKTDKAPETDDECDPDMIGFEIITG